MTAYYNENDPYAAEWLRNLIAAGHIAEGVVDDRSIAEVTGAELAAFDQCHFFAGIGGWSLALRLAGWDDTRPVWTGSCPCQPFSAAGKGLGVADERHLWPEFYRLIAECAPPIVFGEQVASRAGREWLAGVRADLEAVGYAVGAADLCAAGVGAPHIRQRLWWAADAGGAGQREQRRGELLDGHRPACGYDAHGCGEVCGLEHAARDGRQQWRPESGGWSAESRCGESGLGDASGTRLEIGVSDGGIRRGQRRTPEGQAAQLSGAWGNTIWLPCADGKARRIGFNTLALVDGLPGFLGAMRADQYAEAIHEVVRYGQAVTKRPGEVLREVQQAVLSQQAPYWPMGEPAGIRQQEILLAYLRELEARCEAANEDASRAEAPKTGMRSVRDDQPSARAPRQWESRRLERGQHPDALHALSRLLAQHAQAAWLAHYRENAMPIAPLSIGESARVGRLRAYGNAIVPQVAAEFIQAFEEAVA